MNSSEIESFVFETVSKVLNRPVKTEDNFFDLGGSSLELSELLGIINRQYNVTPKIKVKEIMKLQFVDRIVEYICLKVQSLSSNDQ